MFAAAGGNPGQHSLVERIGTELKKAAADPDVAWESKKINEPLRDVTIGAHPHLSELVLQQHFGV